MATEWALLSSRAGTTSLPTSFCWRASRRRRSAEAIGLILEWKKSCDATHSGHIHPIYTWPQWERCWTANCETSEKSPESPALLAGRVVHSSAFAVISHLPPLLLHLAGTGPTARSTHLFQLRVRSSQSSALSAASSLQHSTRWQTGGCRLRTDD